MKLTLDEDHLGFLRESAEKFELPSQDKALRCCINWAAQTHPSLVVEEKSGEVRNLEVADSQHKWLEARGEPGDVARAVVVAAMQASGPDVFQVLRCKSHTPCVPGAQCLDL